MDRTPDEYFARLTDAARVLTYTAAEPSESDAEGPHSGEIWFERMCRSVENLACY